MPVVHVLLLAETLPDAERLAVAWRDAAPHVGTEVRAVHVPGAGAVPALPGHGADPGPGGVLLAGAAIPVGPPAGAGVGGVSGPSAPGPAPSALPAAEQEVLAGVAAQADVVVAYAPRLDGEALRRGVVVEAAAAAADHAVPVVAVTDRSEVTRRQWSTAGLSGVHELADGDVARVARTWTPGWV